MGTTKPERVTVGEGRDGGKEAFPRHTVPCAAQIQSDNKELTQQDDTLGSKLTMDADCSEVHGNIAAFDGRFPVCSSCEQTNYVRHDLFLGSVLCKHNVLKW